MIKNIIATLLGRERIFIVECLHPDQYATVYYAVNSTSKNKAIRKVIEHDPISEGHQVTAVINEDVYIAKDEVYYVRVSREFHDKHILIMAPTGSSKFVENIIKYKYKRSWSVYEHPVMGVL